MCRVDLIQSVSIVFVECGRQQMTHKRILFEAAAWFSYLKLIIVEGSHINC